MEDFGVVKTVPTVDKFLLHLDALRQKLPALRTTVFVVAPECNMGLHANELAMRVLLHKNKTRMHMERITVLDEGGSQYGIRTEDRKNILTSKENLRNMAAAAIDNKRVRFLRGLVTVCDPDRQTEESITKRFVQQLERYGADVLPPLRMGDRPRRKWHGKRGAAGDDLAMAFQLNLLANRLFMSQPGKYGIVTSVQAPNQTSVRDMEL